MTEPVDLSHVQFGPKAMACTLLERRFAYILGAGLATNASDAAALAGYSTKGRAQNVRGFENMRKPHVLEAIEEAARTEFRGLVGPTIQAAKNLILNDKHPDHAKAVNSMLSRLDNLPGGPDFPAFSLGVAVWPRPPVRKLVMDRGH